MLRLTKEEYVCYLALAASSRSEDFFTQVGAALLDTSGNVLGTGFNGLKAGTIVPEWMKLEENRSKKSNLYCHAEMNLWQRKKNGDEYLLGLTMSPCKACSQLISASKVKKVIYIKEYERGTQDYKEIFDFHKIEYRLLTLEELSRITTIISSNIGLLNREAENRLKITEKTI